MSKAATASETQPAVAVVNLVTPIRREGGDISSFTLRKPKGGELRGLKVQDIVNTDVNTILALAPRICSPFIAQEEFANLDADDFAEVAGTIMGFFMTRSQVEMINLVMGQESKT